MLGHLGSMSAHVGAMLVHLGAILAHLVPMLAYLGPMLALLDANLIQLGANMGQHKPNMASSLGPWWQKNSRTFMFFDFLGFLRFLKKKVWENLFWILVLGLEPAVLGTPKCRWRLLGNDRQLDCEKINQAACDKQVLLDLHARSMPLVKSIRDLC